MHRVTRLFARALRLRCPHCGGGPAFVRWFTMVPACPSCGISFQRGERGYWLGAYLVSCIVVMAVFTAWWLVVVAATAPDIPWRFLHLSTITLMLLTPVLAYPMSRTLFLAFDLAVRPPEPEDFRLPEERAPGRRPR
ncbi:MAG: DUF983 domain-containing protein [Gemmatimonadales bacterium]|jgi:uncharacterized protein (DUF983 family)|nr:DUF983 domain-containing protein [Gemmatimonadales bacterium]